jgi:hypothetical protein
MYFIISSCTDAIVCFDLRHASVRPDYTDINFLVDNSHKESTHGCVVLYTPVIHAVIFLDGVMMHYEGTIELIKDRLFSMNDKFEAIVDNLKVPVCNDYLCVKRLAPLVAT